MNYQWMRERRKELRISQEEFAEYLTTAGWPTARSSVASWEKGYNNIPIEKEGFLMALTTVFKMTVAEVLAGLGYPTALDGKSPEIIRVTELMKKLPVDAQKEVLEHAEIVSRRYLP